AQVIRCADERDRRIIAVMRKLLLAAALLAALPLLADRTENVNAMLDAWHRAAAEANEAHYFDAMTPEFVFLGTDASERWDKKTFREFSHPYFAKGTAWTFKPHDRHV